MKSTQTYLLTLLLSIVGFVGSNAQKGNILWQYDMSDGSTIHAMSDNGKWAVAYGVSEATSAYSFPKLVNLTTHTQEEILTENELNSGVECFLNDVTNDGATLVGCYNGQPAYYNATTKKWVYLPVVNGNLGGRVEAVTPDGKYAIGVCTQGGYDEVPAMWDMTTLQLVTLEGLPPCDLSGHNQGMTRLTDLSADGRYLVGCVSYSYPADVLYFLYDRTEEKWDAIAFDYNALKREFTPRDNKVRTLDGICISPNGKWVAGVVYSTDDNRNPFRYNVETKTFENINRAEDLDKGCVNVDNEGTIYAATPAINPSRSLYILRNGHWYGIDEVLKQNYGIDFYTYTGYQSTGLCIEVSDDCKTMCGIAYISHENYQITLPKTFAEACDNVNLLATYTSSVRSGAQVQKLSNITLTFTRDVEVLVQPNAISLVDENGNLVKNSLKIAIENASSKQVTVGFRTTTLEKNKKYTVIIPKGSIALKGDATKTNEEIVLQYIGLGDTPLDMAHVTPASGSTLGHIDINTNPVIFTFNVDVAVKEGAKALVYRNDETEPAFTLEMQHGTTSQSYNMVLVYPTSTLYLYRDNEYRIVIPAGSLTDAAGYSSNAEVSVSYIGSYERTVVSDDTHIYIETFENGISNVMLYDGDGNEPVNAMKAWSFASNIPWMYAADDDYTNTCAVSHSMYSPVGTSNDWMVTPQLYIPDGKCVLSFDAQSYRMGANDVLKVIVYASEESINELDADIIKTMETQGKVVVDQRLSPGIAEEVLNGDWEQFQVKLDQFAGKNVYIAFVNQNTDKSAIFVGNIQVTRNVDFQIALVDIPEVVVAQDAQTIKGSVILKDTETIYNSATVTLKDATGKTIEQLNFQNLNLGSNQKLDFQFNNALPLQIGKECKYSVNVSLNNGATMGAFDGTIKNLAFTTTKRVILEENTGMGCQNCPLGHQALELLEHTYGDLFIPVAYHTYTGDQLESGMTDYAQYFLGLSAAPTGMIQRNKFVSAPMVSYTENGVTDYTFYSRTGDTWADLVSKEFATPALADLSLASQYDAESGDIIVNYKFTSAIDKSEANIGLLFIITEDGLTGYQSNGFSSATDTDLGEWQKGGLYGKSTVAPYTFNDVARALYPAAAYYGQTGLLPAELNHSEAYGGIQRISLAQDAPYVKNVNNCKITCVAIDANTGEVINAARVKVGETMTDISSTVSDSQIVNPTENGVLVKTTSPAIVTIYDVQGKIIATCQVETETHIPTSQKGLLLVKITNAHGNEVHKVIR